MCAQLGVCVCCVRHRVSAWSRRVRGVSRVRAGVATCACACAQRNGVIERRSRRSDRRCDRGRRSALGARTLKTVGAGALGGSISSTWRVRVRARHPRRGEAGGSCHSSRLGGGAWVRPLGYKTPLYSSDDPWRVELESGVRRRAFMRKTHPRVLFIFHLPPSEIRRVCERILQASGSVSLSVRLCVDCAQIPGR